MREGSGRGGQGANGNWVRSVRKRCLGLSEGKQETLGAWVGGVKICFIVLKDPPNPGAEGLWGPEQRMESSEQAGAAPGEDDGARMGATGREKRGLQDRPQRQK